MADHRAIAAVSEGIMGLLRSSYPETDMDFRVVTSRDFAENTITNGASLFMYRVFCNGTFRIPPGHVGTDGLKRDTELPLELHFLITLWGGEASQQYTLAGWIMRTLEDTPILPASILNSVVPGVFREDESVDILLADLSTEDLFRIWEVIGNDAYQLSIPYVARIIHIESERRVHRGEPVQLRRQRMAEIIGPDNAV
jgi:hypothetical protein